MKMPRSLIVIPTSMLAAAVATSGTAQAQTPPATAAATFIATQFATGGDHFPTSDPRGYGYTTQGVIALASAGTAQAQMRAAADHLIASTRETFRPYGLPFSVMALAQHIVMLKAVGLDPRAQHGVDQVALLQGLEYPEGRFHDLNPNGNYAQTYDQVWSMLALRRAGAPVSTKAVNHLMGQQCADGGFRLEPDAPDCVSDANTTALAAQFFAATGRSADLTKTVDFLAAAQDSTGGVPGTTTGVNTATTGLAAVAFTLAGRSDNAARAAAYVRSLQFGCSAPPAMRGAIATDKTSFDAQMAKGAAATPTVGEYEGTSLGIHALTGQGLLEVSAHGADQTIAIACATSTSNTASSTSTASATSQTSATSGTASSTGTGSASTSTSDVTGPPVVTDGGSSGGADPAVLMLAAGGLAVVGIGGAAAGVRGGRRR
ncbi:hypothetical protein [Yimella sp. cx-51]|uniref:hypothetical protein n=1 Tax=Yimella sp. cx-51 TaxID=2770551 RepID=UPI00165DF955|nr:hypothetical protein [Yimella sp. cx-51]MBC9957162.1 hypothetical protein [Yimella sp. cx-51]QTH37188.1 hypothetical protein J5M86_09755 [Yimella sp. cx-51]